MTERPDQPKPSEPASVPGPPEADVDWVAIGEVVGAFGLRGEVKVSPLTDFPERFSHTQTVYVGEKHVPYRVEGAHPHKQQVLLRLEGVATIGDAERLRGAILWIPGAEIAPLPEGHYYLHDIVGLRVDDVRGRHLGTVADVLSTGANDVYIVRRAEADGGAEVLLPAVKEFIKAVDVARGIMIVDPIPGLFDDEYDEAR
jgi:16S rRNA processing protein RimM